MKSVKKFLIAGFVMVAFTACEKCYECTQDEVFGDDVQTVCDTPTQAEDRAENLENDGYSCTVQ